VGVVAAPYMTSSSATMEIAGNNETNSCVATWRLGRDGTLRAPNSPVSALPLRVLKVCDSGGSGTCRSLSDNGGARCGFHLATMIT